VTSGAGSLVGKTFEEITIRLQNKCDRAYDMPCVNKTFIIFDLENEI